jgi:hypothetical protein
MDEEFTTFSYMDPQQLPMNGSNLGLEDFKIHSNFNWLLCSLVSTMACVIYITCYNSRLFGYLMTHLLNRLFIHEGYMHVGKFDKDICIMNLRPWIFNL